MRQYPTPEHAAIAARQPERRDLLAAIVANRAFARCPVTAQPLTPRQLFESECG